MKRFPLNHRMTLELAAAPRGLRCFAGKTNRLALYSVRALCLELQLYVKRDWPEDVSDRQPADDLTGTPCRAPIPPHAG